MTPHHNALHDENAQAAPSSMPVTTGASDGAARVALLPRVLLSTDALRVGYNGTAILPPLTFSLQREELLALIGRNGQGKSTLLRTMLGLLPSVGGSVTWQPGAHIGYVPQRSEVDLAVPMRVRDIVAMGMDHRWSLLRPLRGVRAKVHSVLEETGTANLIDQPFAALSGGQQQRVLVSRALCTDPDVLILDEPTNGMDLVAEHAAFDLFARLRHARDLALIVVSHHVSLLATRASHVLWVDRTEQIVAQGPIDDMQRNGRFMEHWGAMFAATKKAHEISGPHRSGAAPGAS